MLIVSRKHHLSSVVFYSKSCFVSPTEASLVQQSLHTFSPFGNKTLHTLKGTKNSTVPFTDASNSSIVLNRNAFFAGLVSGLWETYNKVKACRSFNLSEDTRQTPQHMLAASEANLKLSQKILRIPIFIFKKRLKFYNDIQRWAVPRVQCHDFMMFSLEICSMHSVGIWFPCHTLLDGAHIDIPCLSLDHECNLMMTPIYEVALLWKVSISSVLQGRIGRVSQHPLGYMTHI